MAETSRYRLKDTLGLGGMGVIFRARDTLMNRDVALKTILDVGDQGAKDLFYREWGIQASITHPNIAEIYDIGEMSFEGQNRPYFVMPLLRGATLGDLLRRDGHSLTPDRVIAILLQACRGLQAAHERKLIHRDLKPSNVFVLEDDSVKLIDFGIAHAGGSAHTSVRGTLSYMAPELLDGKPASAASDIFAAGVLSYEALTGRRPFPGPDDAAIAQAIRTVTPVPPSEIDPRIPGDVSRVIFKALAKQPWQRYGSVREFADYLNRAARREPIDLFDPAKVGPRMEKAMRAFERGDYSMATDIVAELEGEGNVDQQITSLRRQVEQAQRGVRIRQYLENARRLFDEQEYSLALRKVHEALELDEANPDSLALKNEIEKRRRARTAQEWSELARRHLDNNTFAQARSVLGNLLELKPDDTGAIALRSELDRREAEFDKVRGEKERLQKEARGAWDRGEVTSAMSSLERWMDIDRFTPETDASKVASVRNLFVTVRSEHEALRNAYEQARAMLEAGKFDEASGLCNLYLSKYPNHALFQSVRFDIDERRRQALSAFIAETDRRAGTEPDLDRRVAILEEAARRYPEESHFQRALEPARAKRDLVNSVLARARLFEERGKFSEALEQWELLGPVHGAYPGLEYEKDRVRKRREAQGRCDAKAAWIARVESMLDRGEYERGCADAARALSEFPGDPEIEEIGRTAEIRHERGFLAAAMVEDARAQLERGEPAAAVETLRKALAEDERHPVAKPLLARTLAEQARTAMEAGDRDAEAEALLAEAAECDPDHALVRGVRAILADRQRERAVSEVMAEARRLFNERNLAGALEVCRTALVRFPGEGRLSQLAANLSSALEEQNRKARKKEEPAAEPAAATPPPVPQALVAQPAPPPAPAPASRPVPKPRGSLAAVGAAAVCLALIGGGIQFFRSRHAPEAAIQTPATPDTPPAGVEPVAPPPPPVMPALAVVNEIDGAKITVNGAAAPEQAVPGVYAVEVTAQQSTAAASFQVGADGAVTIQKAPVSNGPRLLLIDRTAGRLLVHAPAGDEPWLDGKAGIETAAGLDAHEIEIRRQGEEPRSIRLPPLTAGGLQIFVLRRGKPDFGTIVVSSNVDDVRVRIDSYDIPFAVKNGTALPRIPPGSHKVVVKKDGYEPLEPVTVTVKAGEDAMVKVNLRPLEASFSARGLPAGSQLYIDGSARDVAADGSVQATLRPGDHTFELRKGNARSKAVTRNARAGEPLAIGAAELALIPATGTLAVDVQPAGAAISVKRDGETSFRAVTPPVTLPEGAYTVSASAPGHSASETRVTIAAGKTITASLQLAAAARREPESAPARPAPTAAEPPKPEMPGWRESNGWMRRRGGGFAPMGAVKPGSPVSFQAALPDGRRLQWMISRDAKNYMLFKLERRKFVQIAVTNGKQRTVAETPVDANLKEGVAVRIAIAGAKAAHTIGGSVIETELPPDQTEGGQFGFTIPGGDEFAVRDFKGR